jgi:hypothetical protein
LFSALVMKMRWGQRTLQDWIWALNAPTSCGDVTPLDLCRRKQSSSPENISARPIQSDSFAVELQKAVAFIQFVLDFRVSPSSVDLHAGVLLKFGLKKSQDLLLFLEQQENPVLVLQFNMDAFLKWIQGIK